MMDMSTEAVQRNIGNLAKSTHDDPSALLAESTKDSSTAPVKAAHIPSDVRVQETVAVREHNSKVAATEETPKTLNSTPESQFVSARVREEKAPLNVEAPAAAPKEVSRTLYSGKVTVVIPRGASESWMRQLWKRLRNTPGVHIVLNAYDSACGCFMSLSLDSPIPLPSILQEMPNVESVGEENGTVAKTLRHRLPEEMQQTILVVRLSEAGKSKSQLSETGST